MVTTDAAKALAIDGALGRIEEKYLADLFVLSGDTAQPYLSLVLARPQSVRLVMIDGKVLYGDKSLEDAKSYDNCDTLDICGRQRFLCVALPDTNNKLNQSYQTIVNNINTALTDKQFPSIAPLTNCAP
ncbi:MAG: amidohydrolase family protein, partial [Myxococcales bacterium]|nr:amidohydrolase family protein [Myxococcales bacterium]